MANILKKKVNQALVYLRATEAVSRPIAFLMALFVLFFFISTAFGIFLLGRWGYRQVVHVDKPAVVSVPEANKPATDNPAPSNTSQPAQTNSSASQTATHNATQTTTMPNTGGLSSVSILLAIIIIGYFSHQSVWRIKRKV